MTSRARTSLVPLCPLLGALLALFALQACTFERRADTDVSEPLPADASADTAGTAPGEDSVLGVVDAFHRALASGDAARVAQLVSPEALLVDQEEGVLWTAESADALPSSLESVDEASGGLAWERVGTRVDAVGPARLVILRYRAQVAGEAVAWWGLESLLLRPGADGGWRIHYLHRSRGPGRPGGLR